MCVAIDFYRQLTYVLDSGIAPSGSWVRRAFVIELRILGPVELLEGGVPARLSPQQRILLLGLLLADGDVQTVTRLAEIVWGTTPPTGWRVTLRGHVHHLRRALAGSGGIGSPLATMRVADETGYLLRIPPEAVDARTFERLATDGRAALSGSRYADATALLGRALELWRGRPLADAADRPFVVTEIARLEALHRAVLAARLEADIGRGLYREVTGELQVLVARWPEDEGVRSLLVVCLARAGRHAEAARVCQHGIVLALGLGLDAARLHALQRDVLNGLPGSPP